MAKTKISVSGRRISEAERGRIEQYAEQVLNRLDSKGETIAEAVEAVTGSGDPALVAEIAAALGACVAEERGAEIP